MEVISQSFLNALTSMAQNTEKIMHAWMEYHAGAKEANFELLPELDDLSESCAEAFDATVRWDGDSEQSMCKMLYQTWTQFEAIQNKLAARPKDFSISFDISSFGVTMEYGRNTEIINSLLSLLPDSDTDLKAKKF